MPTYCGVDLGHLGEALVHLLAGGNNLGRRGEGGGRGRRGRRGRGGGGERGREYRNTVHEQQAKYLTGDAI